MILSSLLNQLEYTCLQGDLSVDVTAVVNDSRKLEKGCLFLCIKGASFDGHQFASEAANAGASVLFSLIAEGCALRASDPLH